MKEKKEYTIGEFSQISRFSVKTLRYYDEMGLLAPSRKDGSSGYRYYDEEGVNIARGIHLLKDFGFTLQEIKEMIQGPREDENLLEHLLHKIKEVEERIKEYRRLRLRLEMVTRQIEENKDMNIPHREIKTIHLAPLKVASIRYKGCYNEVGLYIGRIFKEYASVVRGKVMSLYWDREYKEEGADIELCIPVKKELPGKSVEVRELEGGQYISLIHQGGYDSLGESYQALTDYCKAHHLEIEVPTREIYHKGPGMIFRGNPKKYVTEIQFPVK